MDIKQSTSEYNILASGSVFTFKSQPLRIEFADGSVQYKIEFHFLDNSDKGQKVDCFPTKDENDQEILQVNIYNAQGAGGTGEPISILQQDSKNTFISIGFQKYTESFILTYTVFRNK